MEVVSGVVINALFLAASKARESGGRLCFASLSVGYRDLVVNRALGFRVREDEYAKWMSSRGLGLSVKASCSKAQHSE